MSNETLNRQEEEQHPCILSSTRRVQLLGQGQWQKTDLCFAIYSQGASREKKP